MEEEKIFHFPAGEFRKEDFVKLLHEIRHSGKKARIELENAPYFFRQSDSFPVFQPVSNTLKYDGKLHIRHVGLLLEGINDLTINGNGAQFIFDGEMTPVALLDCSHVTLQNFSVDFLRRRVSEMTLLSVQGNTMTFQVHQESPYRIRQGEFFFTAPSGREEKAPLWQLTQIALPEEGLSNRTDRDPVREAVSCRDLGENRVEFTYRDLVDPLYVPGQVWQFRNPERNEVGILLHHCKNLSLHRLHLKFTPGLGVIAQLCENISITEHSHAPDPAKGLVCSAFADCIHFSACRGSLQIRESFFSGSQDDPINIHGVYLQWVSVSGNVLKVRFPHPETWGFLPFEEGDRIAAVDKASLQKKEYNHIRKAQLLNDLEILLTLEKPFTENFVPEETVIENLSAYGDVLICNNHFTAYPTRGVLISSAGKCVVRNNLFHHKSVNRVALLVAADASSWYESGAVQDLTIEENIFEECCTPSVAFRPENTVESMVHSGVRIRNNRFENCSKPFLEYRSSCIEHDLSEDCILCKDTFS